MYIIFNIIIHNIYIYILLILYNYIILFDRFELAWVCVDDLLGLLCALNETVEQSLQNIF